MRRIVGVLNLHRETGSEGGYWAIQDRDFIEGDRWSYEGLHIIQSGDRLTVYGDAQGEVLWHGTVTLHPYPPFTETAHGQWIHADIEGLKREDYARWFLDQRRGVVETD
jgi:hypothetical protein